MIRAKKDVAPHAGAYAIIASRCGGSAPSEPRLGIDKEMHVEATMADTGHSVAHTEIAIGEDLGAPAAPRIMRTDEPKEDYDGEAEARHGEQSE